MVVYADVRPNVFPIRSGELEKRLRDFRRHELGHRTHPSALAKAKDLAPRLLLMASSYAGLLLVDEPWTLLCAVGLALSVVSLLGSWFHDAVHGNARLPALLVATVTRLASAPVGFSPRWWQYKHVRLHHRYVSNPAFDPDIQFGQVARVVGTQRWRPLHRAQHVYLWFLLPFATVNMLKPGELWQRHRFAYCRELAGAPPGWVFLADKYVPFAVFWTPLFLVLPPLDAVLALAVFQVVTGTLVSVVTQVQHNTQLAEGDDDYSMKWPLCEQLVRTTDVRTARFGPWWWLSGGTSFHVVHHLAPSLSFLELPAVTRRLDRCLAEMGFTLPAHPTLTAAVRSHGRLLRQLSTP
ncbi:fatty acid desaturase family protein [Saccharothrix stipae]